MSNNPLLDLGYDIPFETIRAEHVEPAIDALVDRTEKALSAIGGQRLPLTYESTFEALERATESLERAISVVAHLEAVTTYPALRAAYNAAQPKVSELFASIPLDAELYRTLGRYAETEEAAGLSPVKRRFVDKTLREFRRHGAELSPEGKARLREIDVELAKATMTYAQNVLDETAAFELYLEDEGDLEGLPQSARQAARASAEGKGKEGYRFTLQGPSLGPLLSHLSNRAIRETVWRAYTTRASAEPRNNRTLIQTILRLRKDKAKLLGFDTFADFVLEERMAKRGDTAKRFLSDLAEKSRPFFQRERQALLALTESEGGPADLAPWDVAYFSEKMRKKHFDFDEEDLRPYFQVDRVLEGLFTIVERLYGVRVEEREDASLWHPSVRCFLLRDEGGRELGTFYADLFPRENKRGGAWMNAFVTGARGAGQREPHLGLICANVTPPVGEEKALLTHREVETLLHEFGHLMHHLLSEVEVKSLSGTSVAWDFVELPSQIMENWAWEREALDLLAAHHQTGAPIPEPLFARMKKARTHLAATAMMRQLGFGHADLRLHIESGEGPADPVRFAKETMQPFQHAELPDDYAMICSFHHLFASPVGYAAGYYSYKWAEVLDADAFERFREAGIFDREVGSAFRDTILARGDSDEPEALFRAFMGRDPSPDALLIRSGLVQAGAAGG